ncbi:YwpF-like family protein [Oceanobacillus massiliensis]|uniref:YwpF-like family protein n=1 Tax=Oceanobacillus massiliensis TaxID=1465765 RepID=UPI0002892FAD|nr:YwpF-like family protein [Oceanobacillus massiliensis]
MKTFKLKKLEVLGHHKDIKQISIELLDGLIINREDENNQWLIEAYIEKSLIDYFTELYENKEEIMLLATITKESNEPATFITRIHGINEIGDNLNVLFIGSIIDRRKNIVEELLTDLVNQGYQGKALLEKFKELA